MKAVVLAAGIGSRLRPITVDKPKGCVTVDSVPILERQLRAYADAGVDDVAVVAGYMADQIRDLCRRVAASEADLSITVIENEAFANTDNCYSLYCAREFVAGDPFFLSNGDVVFDPSIVEGLRSADPGSAIAVDTSTFDEEAMKVVLDDRGRISHISKRIGPDEAYASSIDVYRFSAAFSAALFAQIERIVEVERTYDGWTELAIDDLVGRGAHDVEPFDIAGHDWVEVDDFDDLHEADRTFAGLDDLRSKSAVFFDLDGTITLDETLVDGADRLVRQLREDGVDVYFLSNNSSQWKSSYADRLSSLGIPTTVEEIILSTDGVIEYLLEHRLDETFVVGTSAMREALEDRGITVDADEPAAVVVGFDTELTYEKLRRATLAIRDGAEFLLAHPDTVCPTTDGFVPDCGSIGALVETATGRSPTRVFGKPNPDMLEHVLTVHEYASEDVAIVGDRLETDVELGHRLGCETVCVLSGEATRLDVEVSDRTPSLVVPSVRDLVPEPAVPEEEARLEGAIEEL